MMPDREEVVDCLIENLEMNLTFCRERGITTRRDLSEHKLTRIIEHPLWVLLELNGKFRGRYVSVNAFVVAKNLQVDVFGAKWDHEVRKILRGSTRGSFGSLFEFDHVAPKRFLVENLLTGALRAADVRKHLTACVVTKDEHTRITNHQRGETVCWYPDDPWRTYKNLGISVFDRSTREQLALMDDEEGSGP